MSLALTVVGGGALGAPSPSSPNGYPAVPTNEWPDPNFYIQDTSLPIPAMNDALTGATSPVQVSGYTIGSREVTVQVASTSDLAVGQYVAFSRPCDAALRATILQIQSIVPDRSFSATLEYPSGVPAASASCMATVVQHGDTTGGRVGGGDITSNVHRFADCNRFPDFWISDRPAQTRLMRSGVHVLIVRKITDRPESVYWGATTPAAMAGTGRAIGVAVVVANGAGARARAYINTGAIQYGPSTATAPTRTWLTAHTDVPSSAQVFQEGVVLEGPVGSTFVLGEFESVPYATTLPDGAFSTPTRQTIMALASISPYVGVAFILPKEGGSFDVNMGQASNLAISGGVTAMIGDLEGQCTTFPATLSVASPTSPTVFGPMLHQLLDATGHLETGGTTPSAPATGPCGTITC